MKRSQWTINELGVKYKEELTQEGGHAVPRMYSTYNQSGSAIVTQQLVKLKELGVQPRFQCFLTKIYRDEDGRGPREGDRNPRRLCVPQRGQRQNQEH